MQQPKTLLRLAQVLAHIGESRTTLYTRIKQGLFTPPVHLGSLSVAWPADEVAAIVNARIAGKSDDEIKSLVRVLAKARLATAMPANDIQAVMRTLVEGKSNSDIQDLIKALQQACPANS